MKLKIILAVLMGLLVAGASFAQTPVANKPIAKKPRTQTQVTQIPGQNSADAAWQRLSVVEDFAFGGVGFAGVISNGEKDYFVIMSQANALAMMNKLYKNGNAQAKSYALVGLKELDPKGFEELAEREMSSSEMVNTMTGCIVQSEAMREVVRRIVAGNYSNRKSSVRTS